MVLRAEAATRVWRAVRAEAVEMRANILNDVVVVVIGVVVFKLICVSRDMELVSSIGWLVEVVMEGSV